MPRVLGGSAPTSPTSAPAPRHASLIKKIPRKTHTPRHLVYKKTQTPRKTYTPRYLAYKKTHTPRKTPLPRCFAYKKISTPRTLPYDHAWGPRGVLGGWPFSYERASPVSPPFFISHRVGLKSFCKSQYPQKIVNLFFT